MLEIGIIGGGAAGFFAAITAAEENSNAQVTIYERGKSVLEKVRVSGGGRCNVTHACFDPRELVQNYPRGSRELLGPFMQFSPGDTVSWFANRGVELKTEADGRMFPFTDSSDTIIQCMARAAAAAGVVVNTGFRAQSFSLLPDNQWQIHFDNHSVTVDRLMIATGSSTAVWDGIRALGHTVVDPVPSLFTFNTKDTRLRDLSGLSMPKSTVKLAESPLKSNGPLLITHWGLSGPAILRLSAWGARQLFDINYKFLLLVNWLGEDFSSPGVAQELFNLRAGQGKKNLLANPAFGMPLRLWQHLGLAAGIPETLRWADLDKKLALSFAEQLTAGLFQITGKSTFKDEFVTAGGISLKEINFKNFSSRLFPNLFFAGEVLDIDGITGGFNFQAAWTGGYLAGKAMAKEEE